MELMEPEKEWEVVNMGFMKPEGFEIKLSSRQGAVEA